MKQVKRILYGRIGFRSKKIRAIHHIQLRLAAFLIYFRDMACNSDGMKYPHKMQLLVILKIYTI